MGYFSWEERFDLGFGSKKEYKILRSERGSYKDNYELKNFDDALIENKYDILVKVQRIPQMKKFSIPLSELQAVIKSSHNYQLLNDFTVWIVNY